MFLSMPATGKEISRKIALLENSRYQVCSPLAESRKKKGPDTHAVTPCYPALPTPISSCRAVWPFPKTVGTKRPSPHCWFPRAPPELSKPLPMPFLLRKCLLGAFSHQVLDMSTPVSKAGPSSAVYTDKPTSADGSGSRILDHYSPALITPRPGARQLDSPTPQSPLKSLKRANPEPFKPVSPVPSLRNHSQAPCPCFPLVLPTSCRPGSMVCMPSVSRDLSV